VVDLRGLAARLPWRGRGKGSDRSRLLDWQGKLGASRSREEIGRKGPQKAGGGGAETTWEQPDELDFTHVLPERKDCR